MNGSQSYGPASSYGTRDFTTPARDRSATDVALDNLIRRRLRVSDPSNPHEVALALQGAYATEREAMAREAAGLPFVSTPVAVTAPAAASSSSAEVDQARADVDRDLNSLCGNALLKDIEPELKGWGYAIRNAVSDGINAARFALDPRQRERAFAARRLLGDYARMARYVGSLTPTMNLPYRRFAQSLDEVAALLLVLMGEALANIGFSGGRFLLQVAASELQERRDAVIYALRNLIGSTQQAYGPNEWPRGLVAYQQFMARLEATGQADLKALFQESYLGRLMDDLIDRAASTNAEGLRALGSTAQLGVESFRRLIILGQRVVTPESPALAAFLSALQLFVDPFDDRNFSRGSRLLFISRPPIVFYGLYGIGGPDEGAQRLINLVMRRGTLAELLDCYLGCQCSDGRSRCQILLDKILYDLDRAIDLYALGTDPEGDGEPEQRAAAYGFVIYQLLKDAAKYCCFTPAKPCAEGARPEEEEEEAEGEADGAWPKNRQSIEDALKLELQKVLPELWYPISIEFEDEVSDIFNNSWTIVKPPDSDSPPYRDLGSYVRRYNAAIEAIESGTPSPYVKSKSGTVAPIAGNQVVIADAILEQRNRVELIHQELCIQRDAEGQWENLLHTMAPSCVRFDGVLDPTRDLLKAAIEGVSNRACQPTTVTIPPHFETSLDSIADDIGRTGEGRPTKP